MCSSARARGKSGSTLQTLRRLRCFCPPSARARARAHVAHRVADSRVPSRSIALTLADTTMPSAIHVPHPDNLTERLGRTERSLACLARREEGGCKTTLRSFRNSEIFILFYFFL